MDGQNGQRLFREKAELVQRHAAMRGTRRALPHSLTTFLFALFLLLA